MPFGIIMSLVVCTVLYIALSLVMTGIAPWNTLGTPEPMITALAQANGPPALINASRFIVALGAVIAMGSVLLVFQLGQPRIFFSMARDGLLPPVFAKVHPALQDALRRHDSDRPVRGDVLGVREHRGGRGSDQHRDPVRVRAGVDRRDHVAAS
jgi:hypothetical protein